MKQTKILGLTMILLFGALVLRGQGWVKTYPYEIGRNIQTDATNLAEAPNGDFIAGTVLSDGLSLMRTNKDGAFIWQRKYTFPFTPNSLDVVCLQDGSIFMYSNGPFAAPQYNNFLLKVNARGDSVSLKKNANWYQNARLIPISDNSLLISENDLSGVGYLTKINSRGDTVWRRVSPATSYAGVSETNDKNILLLFGQNPVSLTKIDRNGSFVWNKVLTEFPSLPGFSAGRTIVGTTDNGSISLIRYRGTTTNIFQYALIKHNSAGVVEWNTTSPYINRYPNYYLTLVPTPDNGVVYMSNIDFGKFDSRGNNVWAKPVPNYLFLSASGIVKTSDNGFLIGGVSDEDPFQDQVCLAKTNQDGSAFSNIVSGKASKVNNCFLPDTAKKSLKRWLVKAKKTNNDVFWSVTDSLGRYAIEMDSTPFELSLVLPSTIWQACNPVISVPTTRQDSTLNIDLMVNSIINCPYMYVDVSSNLLRRCMSNTYDVRYCNQGTATAQNARIEVKLDSLLEYVSATRPLSNRAGQTLIFNLGNVASLDCGNFSITARVRCGDSTRLGQTLCTEAHIYPDTICNPPANWSGANVVVSGRCDRDSVRFLIKNTTGIPTSALRSIVVEDEIVFLNGTNNIPANAIQTITLPANGRTWRLNQQQEPNNPRNALVTAVVEGCRVGTNNFSTNFANDFPNNSGDPTVSTSCLPIVGSYDPNEKLAFPEGFKTSHFIEQNTPIDYQIGFQNTGNDTAFTVILRDTLDKSLDIATLNMGASSHTFTWDLVGKNVLTISFDNIKLVDSFRNEAASHGFVKFRINQKKDVPLGTIINNQAAIYFDFNSPIFTNTTFHTVGKNVLRVSVESVVDKKTTIKVSPNPFSEHTTFELDPSVKTGIFELFDVNGRLLRRETFDNNRFEFQKQDLPTGIFLFKISTLDGQLIGNGKVVAQ